MGQKSSRSDNGRGNPRLPELTPDVEKKLKEIAKGSRCDRNAGLNLEVLRHYTKVLLANPETLRSIVRSVDKTGL